MGQVDVGVIGAGVFGSYHASKAAGSSRASLTGIFDPDMGRSAALAGRSGARTFQDVDALLEACPAVIIATPASTHANLVARALSAGCHVLVEKPLALTASDALALSQAAKAESRILQVGHQERLVLGAMGLLELPEPPTAIGLHRCNPPTQNGRAGDVSVVWDLMIHDIDLLVQLLGEGAQTPAVTAQLGVSGLADEVSVCLDWNGTSVSIDASRRAKDPRRGLVMDFPSGRIRLDFLSRRLDNSSDTALPGMEAGPADPLGDADEAFFSACLGEAPSPIPASSVIETVRLAQQIDELARR